MIAISSRKRKLNSRNEGKLNKNNEKLIFQGKWEIRLFFSTRTTTITEKASSYFVDGALKKSLKRDQEIMTKSQRKQKNENLTSVNSNILALGTEHEQKPSLQQQNLMKNLIKTRNLNKIETGVGLTMSVVARVASSAKVFRRKLFKGGHWGVKVLSHSLAFSQTLLAKILWHTIGGDGLGLVKSKKLNFLGTSKGWREKMKNELFRCYGWVFGLDCVSNIILISKDKLTQLITKVKEKNRTQWD